MRPVHGGIGGRAGEQENDPVAAYIKQSMQALQSGENGGVSTAHEELSRALRAEANPQDWGSGNGVNMV